MMKICFFGVGGVGGYFGAIVANKFAEKHNIYFIARGKHKDAICANGLTLKRSGGEEIIKVNPKLCTDKIGELPVCDIIVLSVKAYDLPNAAKELNKITGEKTIVLPLLNGVDIYDRIRQHLKTGIVLPSCVYVGTHIESPGVIYQKGGACKICIGKDPAIPEYYPAALLTLLQESEISFSCEENVDVSIWSKYMFIAAYGLTTAAFDKTLGEVFEDADLSKTVKSIMFEIEQIARKLNIPLEDDIVETSFLKAKQFTYEAKTSFQRDIELKGKINEADLFGGTLLRYGEKLNVKTLTIKSIFEKLFLKINR